MGVLVLLVSLVVSLPQSDGFCPLACECNEVALSVSCAASKLEVLPITLNPGIQRLQLQHNNHQLPSLRDPVPGDQDNLALEDPDPWDLAHHSGPRLAPEALLVPGQE